MLNLVVICCSTPVMLRIHTFFLPLRTLFFFPLHNFDFEERENRRPCVLSNSLYGSIGNSSGFLILDWAGIRATNPSLSCHCGCLLGIKYTQNKFALSGLLVLSKSIPQYMKTSSKSKIHQNLLRHYCKVIAGKYTRTENLEENSYSLDRDKNPCAQVKNQEWLFALI